MDLGQFGSWKTKMLEEGTRRNNRRSGPPRQSTGPPQTDARVGIGMQIIGNLNRKNNQLAKGNINERKITFIISPRN